MSAIAGIPQVHGSYHGGQYPSVPSGVEAVQTRKVKEKRACVSCDEADACVARGLPRGESGEETGI